MYIPIHLCLIEPSGFATFIIAMTKIPDKINLRKVHFGSQFGGKEPVMAGKRCQQECDLAPCIARLVFMLSPLFPLFFIQSGT